MIKNLLGSRALSELFNPNVRPTIKRVPSPLTDISGVKLKTCLPHAMRLTHRSCALMAEKAKNAGLTAMNETTPYALHSANAEKERLKACVDCPDAEKMSMGMRKAVCQTSGCNRAIYRNNLCNRCWFKRRAKEEGGQDEF